MPDQDLGRAVLRLTTDPTGLQAGMKASRAETVSAIESANQQLLKVGTQLQSTGQKMTIGITLPVIAAGKAIIDTGENFDTTLRKVVGLAGVSKDAIGGIRDRILELGGQVGKTPQELAEAFYFVASAGFKADEAMVVLETSAKASAAGLGRVQDVAQVLGLTINAYGHENITAARAADILTAAVRDGTAEADTFAGVLGRVVPTAAQMGVSFDQVTAAIAGMTITGLSADEAATSLNQILVSLLKPTNDAEKALKDMGTSSASLRTELKEKGLLETLRDLETRFNGNDEAAAKVFGNVRALRGALSLLGLDSAQLNGIFADTKGALDALPDAYAATEGPARDMARAQAELDTQLITLSEDVMPVVIDLMRSAVGIVKTAVDAFEQLPDPVQHTVIAMLALVALAGPVLVFAGAVTTATASLAKFVVAAGPFIPIVAAVSYELDKYNQIKNDPTGGHQVLKDDIQWTLDHPFVPLFLRGIVDGLSGVSDAAPAATDAIAGVAAATITADDATQSARESLHAIAAALPPVAAAYDDLKFTIATWAQQTEEKHADVLRVQREYTHKALELLQQFRTDIEGAYAAATNAALDSERTRVAIATKQAELTQLDKEYTKHHAQWTALQTQQWKLRKDEALAEMNGLKLHLALIGDDIHKETALKSLLASKDMKDNLTSKNDEVKAAYRALRDEALAKLQELVTQGGPKAHDAAAVIAKWMDPKNPLSPLNDSASWGSNIGKEYISKIASAILHNTYLVKQSLGPLKALLEAGSPPKSPENPLHKIDEWGAATGSAWVEHLVGAILAAPASIRSALGNAAAVMSGGFGTMPSLATAAAGAGGFSRNDTRMPKAIAAGGGFHGPLVTIGHIDARGHPEAAGVGAAVKQAVGDAMADVLRDQSRRGLMETSL
jgi:TP901 family phage tail tape measure protein